MVHNFEHPDEERQWLLLDKWTHIPFTSTFKISTWVVKEPTHYSKRVEREVPGVVAVLLSSKCGRLGVTFLKKGLWCMRPRTQKQAQVKKEPCRVVDNVECRCNAQCKWENKTTPLSGRHYLWQGSRITRTPGRCLGHRAMQFNVKKGWISKCLPSHKLPGGDNHIVVLFEYKKWHSHDGLDTYAQSFPPCSCVQIC